MALTRGFSATLAAAAAIFGFIGEALAGQPVPWQMGLQEAATPVMERINDFHNLLLVIIIAITGFVVALLLYVMVRFRASRNPTPSRTSHHTVIEVIWTVFPIMILIVIAIPSFKLLYFMDRVETADMTIKVTGQQFSWTYQYPDHGAFEFDANLVQDEDLEPGQPRLLATDEPLVLPVDTDIRVLVTADPDGVIHAWAVPAFGVKIDAVPGRINETWVRINRTGTYYGQCSELCGTGHGFMPIMVKAVSKADFKIWVERAKEEYAGTVPPARRIKLAGAAVGD